MCAWLWAFGCLPRPCRRHGKNLEDALQNRYDSYILSSNSRRTIMASFGLLGRLRFSSLTRPPEREPRSTSKKKFALLTAYIGSGYQGLQKQTEDSPSNSLSMVRLRAFTESITAIAGVVEDAMRRADLVRPPNNLKKIGAEPSSTGDATDRSCRFPDE